MKDKWQTGIYLFFYILLLAFMADFNVMLLLDAKSFFLLLAGGLLLALPFYRKGMEKCLLIQCLHTKAARRQGLQRGRKRLRFLSVRDIQTGKLQKP